MEQYFSTFIFSTSNYFGSTGIMASSRIPPNTSQNMPSISMFLCIFRSKGVLRAPVSQFSLCGAPAARQFLTIPPCGAPAARNLLHFCLRPPAGRLPPAFFFILTITLGPWDEGEKWGQLFFFAKQSLLFYFKMPCTL